MPRWISGIVRRLSPPPPGNVAQRPPGRFVRSPTVRRLVLGLAFVALGVSVLACSSSGSGGGHRRHPRRHELAPELVRRGRRHHDHPVRGRRRRDLPGRQGLRFRGLQRLYRHVHHRRREARDQPARHDTEALPAGRDERSSRPTSPRSARSRPTRRPPTRSRSSTRAARHLLTYASGPANPFVGSWNVTGYNNGKTGRRLADRREHAERGLHVRRPGLRFRGLQ